MAEPSRSGGLHDLHLASRKAEEAALRRYQAVHWLECFFGPLGIPSQPSEREFISCLRNGLILCTIINKIHPGSVTKVVENYFPVQSESLTWDSQPLPAYQYFENVRNFLVAVRELKLPAFEASDLGENVEAGSSAARVADCILALKSYHEWKEWSGGNRVYKHVAAKSPLILRSAANNFSRPLGTTAGQPCRRLDMSAVDDKQLLKDTIVKALTEHMVDSKENIDDNFLTSFQNGNQGPAQVFSELVSRCLEEKLRNKFPGLKPCFQDISTEVSGSYGQPASILQENICIQNNSEPYKSLSRKNSSDQWRLLQGQERELLDIKALWSQTKIEFEGLQSQLFNDLKHLENLAKEMSTPALGFHKVVQENRKLYNMVQDLKGNVRVHCRIRPMFNDQATNVIQFVGEDGSLVVVDPSKPMNGGRKVFEFSRVYGPTVTQGELFKDAQPLIRSVMDGYNVCILAYGQTGSGKTYTMYGPSGTSAKEMGINFLALNDIFQMADRKRDFITYEVNVQMVDICNEEIQDLLAEESTSDLNESGVPDVTIHSIKSYFDAINLVKHGEKNRIVSLAAMDNQSTHSHSVVIVHVHGKDRSGDVLHGCLHLVDLGGSKEFNSEDSRNEIKESQFIDKSLSCLKDVITSLSQRNSYIPYRNSKLTSLLQESLGGHAKILMFAHVSPELDNLAETVNTLNFAQRVSTVELGAAHSNKINGEVVELKREIENLRSTLKQKEMGNQTSGQLRSPCEKARVIVQRSPLRSRRLSMENSESMKTEKLCKPPLERPKVITEATPQKSPRKVVENPSARKIDKTQDARAGKPKEPRSPCEKSTLEGYVPRSRRLSIENPMIIQGEKTLKLKQPKSPCDGKNGPTKRTPPRSLYLNSENSNSLKSNVDNKTEAKTPTLIVRTGRRLSLEGSKDYARDNINSVNVIVSSDEYTTAMEVPMSPFTTASLNQPTFTDCAAKSPTLQPPRTPEQGKLHQHEKQATMHSRVHMSIDFQTPGTAKSTNGKGSQFRKSLRTIGKLINGSEKKNQQKTDSLSAIRKHAANEAKSPPMSKARALRRQSLTGFPAPASDRRSSLGGISSSACPSDNRNARTPPSVRSSVKITKRWM